MQYRKDEKSGNELSVLGFGCMRFPKNFGAIDMKKTDAMIMTALERGVNYFDTAWIYGGSEEALGTVLAKHGVREKINIATKLPIVFTRGPEDFDKYFDQSLERLKTDHIDYYLMHMLTDIASWERLKGWGIEAWIAEKKKAGKIKRIGFSFHGNCADFLGILASYDWEFCQIQYNYCNENYQAGRTGLKAAAEKGIPVIIMEPLLGGRLIRGLPSAAVEAFKKADPSRSPADWGLNWLWDQSEVSVVLSGMSSMEQVEENLNLAEKAKAGSLSGAEHAVYMKVLDVFNAANKVPCTGCNYCMPCPKEVNIPGSFAALNTSYAISFVEGLKQYVTSVGATSATPHLASNCVKCGKCEEHCPQHIKIRESLEYVCVRLEPFWVRCLFWLVKKFLFVRKAAR